MHRDAEGHIFYTAVVSFFHLLFLGLISEVTERISTKLEHIFTHDCYMQIAGGPQRQAVAARPENLVGTFTGIDP